MKQVKCGLDEYKVNKSDARLLNREEGPFADYTLDSHLASSICYEIQLDSETLEVLLPIYWH